MNIFSNVGITEVIIILLLALLVVGPERLPEMGRKLGKLLRDVRRMYENLSRDLGPEIASIQQPIQELRESVESIRSIPQEMVQTVVKAADLEDTIADVKGATASVTEMGQTLSSVGKVIRNPVGAALGSAKASSRPTATSPEGEQGTQVMDVAEAEDLPEEQNGAAESGAVAPEDSPEGQGGE